MFARSWPSLKRSRRGSGDGYRASVKVIGVLTAGGDSPGLNAAIRAVGKSAIRQHGMRVIGFKDGFRGLAQNRTVELDEAALSGILTIGGTILGTSRDKPNKMAIGDQVWDATPVIMENCKLLHLDALVCLGGGGTQKNALHLQQAGLNVVTLPKTIDNDVAETDVTFGFDTALGIATEAIDRLHSTAHSHHRIIVVEVMGHNAGWLALGAGLAGGADVILLPEIPYSADDVAEAVSQRRRGGAAFSIVVVSEGAYSRYHLERYNELKAAKKETEDPDKLAEIEAGLQQALRLRRSRTNRLAEQLEIATHLEARVTVLGHVQRGGIPSPADRLLATRLGAAVADMVADDQYGVMVATQSGQVVPVPLDEVAGRRKTVPLDHPWINTCRNLGISLGID